MIGLCLMGVDDRGRNGLSLYTDLHTVVITDQDRNEFNLYVGKKGSRKEPPIIKPFIIFYY